MKKKVEREITLCDNCGKDYSVYNKCLECGKDYCYDCAETHGKKYYHAINVSGSDDGYYCNKCNTKLFLANDNDLYKAYKKIEQLKNVQEKFYADFKVSQDKAEQEIQRLLKEIR